MADHKREANFQDDHVLVKRSKVPAIDIESVEKGSENLDIDGLVRNQPIRPETNDKNGSNLQQELSKDGINDTGIPEMSSSKNKVSCNSEVHLEFSKLSCIEADAAEDKGSRHTMEDAWVVLPDASLEYPGKLRCAHFAIYDGHGGRLAAEYAQNHLHKNVLLAGFPRELMDIKAAKKAILEGFRRTDESLLQESAKGNWQDGAAAVCVWILEQTAIQKQGMSSV